MADKIEVPIGFKDDGSLDVAVRKARAAIAIFKELGDNVKELQKNFGKSLETPQIADILYKKALDKAKAAGLELQSNEIVTRSIREQTASVAELNKQIERNISLQASTRSSSQPGGKVFDIVTNGKPSGYVDVSQNDKNLKVNNIVSDEGANSLGAKVVASIRKQLLAEFPDVTSVSGNRISGAREEAVRRRQEQGIKGDVPFYKQENVEVIAKVDAASKNLNRTKEQDTATTLGQIKSAEDYKKKLNELLATAIDAANKQRQVEQNKTKPIETNFALDESLQREQRRQEARESAVTKNQQRELDQRINQANAYQLKLIDINAKVNEAFEKSKPLAAADNAPKPTSDPANRLATQFGYANAVDQAARQQELDRRLSEKLKNDAHLTSLATTPEEQKLVEEARQAREQAFNDIRAAQINELRQFIKTDPVAKAVVEAFDAKNGGPPPPQQSATDLRNLTAEAKADAQAKAFGYANDAARREAQRRLYEQFNVQDSTEPDFTPQSEEALAAARQERAETKKRIRTAQIEQIRQFIGQKNPIVDRIVAEYVKDYGGLPDTPGSVPTPTPAGGFRGSRGIRGLIDYYNTDGGGGRGPGGPGGRGPGGGGPNDPGGPPFEPPDGWDNYTRKVQNVRRTTRDVADAQATLTSQFYRTGAAARENVDHIVRNAAALTNLRRVGLLVGQVSEGPLSQLGYAAAGGLAFAGIAGIAFVARRILNDVEEAKKLAEDSLKKVEEIANKGIIGDLATRAKNRDELFNFADSLRERLNLGESNTSVNKAIQERFNTGGRSLGYGEKVADLLTNKDDQVAGYLGGGKLEQINNFISNTLGLIVRVPAALLKAPFTAKFEVPDGIRDIQQLENYNKILEKQAELLLRQSAAKREDFKVTQEAINFDKERARSADELLDIEFRQDRLNRQVKASGLTSIDDPYTELQKKRKEEFQKYLDDQKKDLLDFARFQRGLYTELSSSFSSAGNYLVSKNPYATVFIEANKSLEEFKRNYGFLDTGVRPISSGGYFTRERTVRPNGEVKIEDLQGNPNGNIVFKPFKADDAELEADRIAKIAADTKIRILKEQKELVEQTKRIKLFEIDQQQFKQLSELKINVSELLNNTDIRRAFGDRRDRELLDFVNKDREARTRSEDLSGISPNEDIRKLINNLSETIGIGGINLSKAIIDATSQFSAQQLKDAGVNYIVRDAIEEVRRDDQSNFSRRRNTEPADVQIARELSGYINQSLKNIGTLDSPEARAKASIALQEQVNTLRGISPENLPPDLLEQQIKATKDLITIQQQTKSDAQTLAQTQLDTNSALIELIQNLPKQLQGINVVELRDNAPLGVFDTRFLGIRASDLTGTGGSQ